MGFRSVAKTSFLPISLVFRPGLRSAANKDGWIRPPKEIDFLVAMNADTAREDVMSLGPNRVVVYEETLNLKHLPERIFISFRFRSPSWPEALRLTPVCASCSPT
jgi:hypothetical protein